jgi:biopolymer transport protein ExbB
MIDLSEFPSSVVIVLIMILMCSLVSLFIIIERLLHLHRAKINVPEFLRGLTNVLKRKRVEEAVAICDESPGPVAHVVRAAILRCDQDEPALRQAVQEVSLSEVPRLEKNVKILGTMAHVAPLLGLLGTVLGMIGMFAAMQTEGYLVTSAELAANVLYALFTTAAGLVVAIPSYTFYNVIVVKIEALLLDMDKAASEMIYFLTHSDLKIESISELAATAAEQGLELDDED